MFKTTYLGDNKIMTLWIGAFIKEPSGSGLGLGSRSEIVYSTAHGMFTIKKLISECIVALLNS